MYAVYVLAAILLSVAPMHATTLLAALPSAAAPRQRTVAIRGCSTHQAAIARPGAALPAAARRAEQQASARANPRQRPVFVAAGGTEIYVLGQVPNAP